MRFLFPQLVLFGALSLLCATPAIAQQGIESDTLTIRVQTSPANVTAPKGASHVEMLSLDLSASCDKDVTLFGIGLQHHGMGRVSDISGVYFSDSSRRITRSVSFDGSSGIAQSRFRSFTIQKCGGVHLTLLADFSVTADTAGRHSVEVLKDMIQSSADTVKVIDDARPMIVSVSPSTAPLLEIVPLTSPKYIRFGYDQMVSRFQLRNVSGDALEIDRMTLTNDGTARDYDLRSLYLAAPDGTALSSAVAHMKAYVVTFDLSQPLVLQRGDVRVVLVKAQVRGSQLKTVQFVVKERGDVRTTSVR